MHADQIFARVRRRSEWSTDQRPDSIGLQQRPFGRRRGTVLIVRDFFRKAFEWKAA